MRRWLLLLPLVACSGPFPQMAERAPAAQPLPEPSPWLGRPIGEFTRATLGYTSTKIGTGNDPVVEYRGPKCVAYLRVGVDTVILSAYTVGQCPMPTVKPRPEYTTT